MDFSTEFLQSAKLEFTRYKTLGDKSFKQLRYKDIHFIHNLEDNSIAVIVKHLSGNMLSRWTNFLTEDGEKKWRKRDQEFIDTYQSLEEMILAWNQGWQCLFNALNSITEENFNTTIYIRGEAHSIVAAIHRQLAHYPSHIGQIVHIAKSIKGKEWTSLSIVKGKSDDFNKKLF